MKFNKEDENYIYEVISKNIKKYRKLKGWTQEKLAEEIDYSLSFIRGIESNYHQTFSLGAIWRISRVLGIDFTKLCEDDNEPNINTKSVLYKCHNCGLELEIPRQIITTYLDIYKIAGNRNLPHFDCNRCNGELEPKNPMDL